MKTRLLYCTALLAISMQADAAITVVERPAPQGQNDYFGSGVAVISDQNSDGIRDLVVGSPLASIQSSALVQPGRANIVSGATGAHLSAILPPSAVDYGLFGFVLPLADLTGDGVAEFAIQESRSCFICGTPPTYYGDSRVHLYNGATLALLNTFTHPSSATNVGFGQKAQSIPDTNNDGVAEIAISAPEEVISGQTYKGKIYLYSGATYALLNTLSSPSLQASGFGSTFEGITDLSGDGKGDLIVGCYSSQGSGAQTGMTFPRAYAINSQTGAIIREFANPSPTNGASSLAISVIADQTSDGVGEVLATWSDNVIAGTTFRGKVMVFNAATGSTLSTVNASNAVGLGDIGIVAGPLHDLSGDSIKDYYYAAASSGSNFYNGQIVFVNGATNSELFTYNSPSKQDYGFFVNAISHPDLNGDTKPDLVFAAPTEESNTSIGIGQSNGRIYLASGATAVLFGSTLYSKSVTTPSTSRTYTLSNTGVEPLDINSIQLTNNASGAFQFASAPDTSDLAIGATRNIVVDFVAVPGGTYTANLLVDTTSNDPSYTLTGYNYAPEIYNNRPIYFSADTKVYLIQTENTSPTLITDNTKIGSPLNYIFAMSYDSQSSLLLQNYIGYINGDKYNIQRVNLITGNRTTISDDTNLAQGPSMGALKDMIVDAPRNRILASSPVAGIIAVDQTTGNRSTFNNFMGYSSITQAPTGEIYCLPTSASRIDQFNPATNTFSSITLLSPMQEFTRIVQGTIFAKSATQLVGHSGGYYPVSINLTTQTITDILSHSNPLYGSAGGPSIGDAGASFDTSGYDLKAGYFLRRNSSAGLILMEESSLFRRTLINTAAVTGTYRMQTVTVPYETYNEASVPTITLGNTTYDLPGGARLTFYNNQSVSILETSFFPGTAQTFVPNPYPGIWTFNGLIDGTFSCGMRFYYNNPTVSQAGLNEQNAVIYRSTDNGATWQPVPSTVNIAGDYVETTNPVSAFSQWTIGFTPTTSVENWSMHE